MNAHVSPPRSTHPGSLGPCPILATSRLILRPHRLSDADRIAATLDDYDVARMLARVPVPYYRQDALEWLERQATPRQPSGWCFAITDRDDLHIGCIGLENRSGQWHVGYWLNRQYWGRGLMSEALHAATESFFGLCPDVILYSGVFADNPASLNVQRKLGFKITGCSEIFAAARNAMVAHIETILTARDLVRP